MNLGELIPDPAVWGGMCGLLPSDCLVPYGSSGDDEG
jgi:hypothetical protein